jgi:hypothetical protein
MGITLAWHAAVLRLTVLVVFALIWYNKVKLFNHPYGIIQVAVTQAFPAPPAAVPGSPLNAEEVLMPRSKLSDGCLIGTALRGKK